MSNAFGGTRSILVVGGGMSGISAAVEAAEAGHQVFLVEREPYLGGRVARMNKYFPKLCPPQCGLEINFRRMKDSPNIRFFTMAQVTGIEGEAGNFDVNIQSSPRFVNENCTGCGKCSDAATSMIADSFNYGLTQVSVARLPHEFAYPMRYILDVDAIGTEEALKIKDSCPYGAIDLEMKPSEFSLNVGAIIWATGWKPFDHSIIPYYGGGKYKNVVSNVAMERMAATGGPTGGVISRPSDGIPVKSVAFVQCAGSRDENNLSYCSGVCCMASLKQASYLLDQDPDARAVIYYIDIRALGKHEDFFEKIRANDRLTLIKGKPGEIRENPETGKVTVQVEDQLTGKIMREEYDLVVLATGMEPTTRSEKVPAETAYDENGFMLREQPVPGIIGAGCVNGPADVSSSVRDATAAVLKAIQATFRR